MKMLYYVDRIEEGTAVCECNGEFFNISCALIPEEAKEGSVLVESCGRYIMNTQLEAERREELFSLQESLFDA